jgi:hypothetical protein
MEMKGIFLLSLSLSLLLSYTYISSHALVSHYLVFSIYYCGSIDLSVGKIEHVERPTENLLVLPVVACTVGENDEIYLKDSRNRWMDG